MPRAPMYRMAACPVARHAVFTAPPSATKDGDKRFAAEEWSKNAVFNAIKQSYLLSCGWFLKQVVDSGGALNFSVW